MNHSVVSSKIRDSSRFNCVTEITIPSWRQRKTVQEVHPQVAEWKNRGINLDESSIKQQQLKKIILRIQKLLQTSSTQSCDQRADVKGRCPTDLANDAHFFTRFLQLSVCQNVKLTKMLFQNNFVNKRELIANKSKQILINSVIFFL